MLVLATRPTFATRWSGVGSIYLETNGMSRVDDPSGTVQVDVPPPSAPNAAQPPAAACTAESSLVQALLDVIHERHVVLPGASLVADTLITDLLRQAPWSL